MEVFALLAEWDYEGSMLLGVFASEEEARTAHGVYTRDGDQFIQHYYIERRTVGSPVSSYPSGLYRIKFNGRLAQ